MSRWFGFVADATPGGSAYDDIASDVITAPTTFVPVTSAQVDSGEQRTDRTNLVMGRRAQVAPRSFAKAPSVSIETLAYPQVLRRFLRDALGGSITTTGTDPAAATSTVGTLQSGNLPATIGWVLREGQLDRVTGMVVGEIALAFPIDGDGTVQLTMPGLYHRTDPSDDITEPDGSAGTLPTAAYTFGDGDTFMLRDAIAYDGDGAGVEIADLAGFNLTFNNGLIDEMRSRFRPGHNIEVATVGGVEKKVWYPRRHKLGPQSVTGSIDFSDVEPDREILKAVAHARKLVFEISAGKLATTPVVDEMMRITVYKHVDTGGGAEPVTRDGDQFASYEFGGFLDPSTGKDIEATFVGEDALT